MRAPESAALEWLSLLEDDLLGQDHVAVFVPSIMGAGILVSLGIVAADAARLASRSGHRARRRAARRAAALVAPLATAAGRPPPTPPSRALRSRRFYAALFIVATAFALYVSIGSTANYLRSHGPFSGVVWMEALAMTASILALLVGLVSLAVAIRYTHLPRWTRRLVERSPLGAWPD